MTEPDDPFVAHRSLLFTVAYEMLGSAADAEDVVQETWLRWAEVDSEQVHDPRAYLVRMVTRQALNRWRTLSRRREEYVGPWLPEPLVIAPDLAEDVELVEHVSLAMLTVLETLTPTERVVFVLHEVFGVPHGEIAESLGKTPAAVRQIGHRARSHVAARRPRMQVDRAEQQRALDAFIDAARSCEIDALIALLAPDVVILTDGGGVVQAALRPIAGPQKVAGFLLGLIRKFPGYRTVPMLINGEPGLVIDAPGEAPATLTVTTADGLITQLLVVRNPAKTGRLSTPTRLSRDVRSAG